MTNSFDLSPDQQALMDAKTAEEAAFDALPLLEQNKAKLAELEQEWSTLVGSMRKITFTVVLRREEDVNFLFNAANEKGFDTDIERLKLGMYNYMLHATRLMNPIAEEVTHWEEWFRAGASQMPAFNCFGDGELAGAYFLQWSYPKHLRPSFCLIGGTKLRNAEAARDRTRILFGQTLCEFEASNGWSSKRNISRSSPTFELVPSEFLRNARRQRPLNPEPTASMFSQWLYSLYASAFGDDQDREKGKAAEKLILAERRKACATTDSTTMRKHFPDWQLKHNGMNSNQSDRPNYYIINDLLVGGEPLRVLPDLIYENKCTNDVIIVEIKHSQMDIPRNLWPNIWGQLWCYSQMQEFRGSPNVTVIGEVWGDEYYYTYGYTRGRGMRREQAQNVYLRASVRRNPRAEPYDRFFRALFDIYRGVD